MIHKTHNSVRNKTNITIFIEEHLHDIDRNKDEDTVSVKVGGTRRGVIFFSQLKNPL
jgi:hypothetical protein